MTASRFIELIALILIPIALLRELWWSRLLFDRPWGGASKPLETEPLDLGGLNALTSGVPAMVLTVVGGGLCSSAWPHNVLGAGRGFWPPRPWVRL